MLNESVIKIVKSTAPILAERGEEITKCFYKRLFEDYPQLLNVFNHTNQKTGEQPRSLATAVYAAAVNIDKLENITAAVVQIAHKHRSVGVQKEHYPIVGEYLLKAIKEVLGDAATDEILRAWEQAYGVIAKAFIDVENTMYEEAEKGEGWKGFAPFKVVRKEQESELVTSFYLEKEDGKSLPAFLPGQYISIEAHIPNEEYTHVRQYSVSSIPNKQYLRLSVKKEGKVSCYLHEDVQVGDLLQISVPAGEFVLQEHHGEPLVFLGGGVGVTPLMSMLETLVDQKYSGNMTFVQSSCNRNLHPFYDHVQELMDKRSFKAYNFYSKPTEACGEHYFNGRINEEWINHNLIQPNAHYYVCGPKGFMEQVVGALYKNGVPADCIHYEFFGPKLMLDVEQEQAVL
jgi:nitric oxide dioxygenase